ncbi:MAG TPA: FadR/GntR family transcriptional regulator [Mesorhizobium sp.]|jgi:DNA-binding FadR family transcriptional regulator|nr:FadR/GntR family transcriptional regulator [Mesorhizobium sp.]
MASTSTDVPGAAAPRSARVADEIAAVILRDLGPGARMPSEAELAEQHKVSRLTVREAIKMLSGRGLLDVGRGRRATVREPSGATFGGFLSAVMKHDPKGLLDLIEVRQALEVQSASSAARQANRAGIAAAEHALDAMREAAERFDEADMVSAERDFVEADVAFHEALALCSGNRMLAYLLEAMAVPLRDSFAFSMRGRELRGGDRSEVLAGHTRILDAVRAGDSRRAAGEMRAHLRDAERDIRVAMRLPFAPERNEG